MAVYAKFGETTPIHLDLSVCDPNVYGVFANDTAPTAPTYGATTMIMTPLAASYQIAQGETTYPVPIVGRVYPTAPPLEVRAHRSGGTETWSDMAVGEKGVINTTFAVAANTGWAIEIRVKTTQLAVLTSSSFTVLAPA